MRRRLCEAIYSRAGRPGSRRQRHLQLAFGNHPFVSLGGALDPVMRFNLIFRHQPCNLVSACGSLTNDPRNKCDRLANVKFVNHRVPLDRSGCRPYMGCDRSYCSERQKLFASAQIQTSPDSAAKLRAWRISTPRVNHRLVLTVAPLAMVARPASCQDCACNIGYTRLHIIAERRH